VADDPQQQTQPDAAKAEREAEKARQREAAKAQRALERTDGEDEGYPRERFLSDESSALVGAPSHEVAGALALAGLDKKNLTLDEVNEALTAYREHAPATSTYDPADEE
jgi:hypothetical protein